MKLFKTLMTATVMTATAFVPAIAKADGFRFTLPAFLTGGVADDDQVPVNFTVKPQRTTKGVRVGSSNSNSNSSSNSSSNSNSNSSSNSASNSSSNSSSDSSSNSSSNSSSDSDD